jgi:parvulin-like peptidyl-prolyl isomerase
LLLSSPLQLLPLQDLHRDLDAALVAQRQHSLEVLLELHGLLRPLAKEIVLEKIRNEVRFTDQELQLMQEQICHGLDTEIPPTLAGDWLEQLPQSIRPQIKARWDMLRLRKWLEEHYGPQVESHFLQRQSDLEQVVFRTIRLRQLGLAEELYLRLIDKEESFGDLASRYSIGDERFTRGLVGPLPIGQPHPNVRAVLARLKVGDISPPFVADNTILLLRLEHRIPARLDETMRQHLLQELFQPDLEGLVASLVARVMPPEAETSPCASVPLPLPVGTGDSGKEPSSGEPVVVGNGQAGGQP